MTLNAKIGGFMDFFANFGLRHKSISFTRWRHRTIVMRSKYRIWYLYINLAWTPQFSAKLVNRNCYRLSSILWALAQISCYLMWNGVCHLLLEINSNLCNISHRFRDIASFPLNFPPRRPFNPQLENVPLALDCWNFVCPNLRCMAN